MSVISCGLEIAWSRRGRLRGAVVDTTPEPTTFFFFLVLVLSTTTSQYQRRISTPELRVDIDIIQFSSRSGTDRHTHTERERERERDTTYKLASLNQLYTCFALPLEGCAAGQCCVTREMALLTSLLRVLLWPSAPSLGSRAGHQKVGGHHGRRDVLAVIAGHDDLATLHQGAQRCMWWPLRARSAEIACRTCVAGSPRVSRLRPRRPAPLWTSSSPGPRLPKLRLRQRISEPRRGRSRRPYRRPTTPPSGPQSMT